MYTHELIQDLQLEDLLQEPPLDAPAMMPYALEPSPDPVILDEGVHDDPVIQDEGVHDDPGLCNSTRIRAEPTAITPTFTGKRHKAAALFLAQSEQDDALVWHGDHLQVGHWMKEVVSKFVAWPKDVSQQVFENGTGAIRISCGKVHLHLGVNLDYSVVAQVKITMDPNVQGLVASFKVYDSFGKTAITPASANLSQVESDAESLQVEQASALHDFVARSFYPAQRASHDFATAVEFHVDDWDKPLCDVTPTNEMFADFFTKPLQAKLFVKFRKAILNLSDKQYTFKCHSHRRSVLDLVL